MNKEQKAVDMVLRKARKLLSQFADKTKADEGACKKTGVLTKFNKTHRNIVSFTFHTPDDITVLMGYDVSQAGDKQYNVNMVDGVTHYLSEKRQEREGAK